jgi:hypothetical protein
MPSFLVFFFLLWWVSVPPHPYLVAANLVLLGASEASRKGTKGRLKSAGLEDADLKPADPGFRDAFIATTLNAVSVLLVGSLFAMLMLTIVWRHT